jgi:hypothetical protein
MSVRQILLIAVALLVAPLAVQAQTAAGAQPRTAYGRPDLQGVWDFRTITPLERPAAQADKAVLTAEEAAQIEAQWATVKFYDRPAREGEVIAYNDFWLDLGSTVVGSRRTSLIVDPPDGRLPPLVPGAPRQLASLDEDLPGERPVRYRAGGIGVDGPEDRGVGVRGILGFKSGPPLMPSGYNNNMQLFQTPDHVVVLTEMVHDARVIPLDGRAHLPGEVRQWNGDSRGHWNGDTLVVETTNFTGKTGSFNNGLTVAVGTGETLHLTERFTRVDAETLLYEYTVEDSTSFSRPFTVAQPMRKNPEQLFEYACHEGNYGMTNMLTGARVVENAATGTAGPE